MEKKKTEFKSLYFERFDKTLNLKVQNDENYTMEDRNEFYLTLYRLVKEEKIKEADFAKKLVYIFDNADKFGSFLKESNLLGETDFAKCLIKINPNMIFYFNEEVKSDKSILDYIAKEAPLGSDLKWPIIRFDKSIITDGYVKLDKKRAEVFQKRYNEANPKYEPRSSKSNYTDYTNYNYIKTNK